MLEVPLPFLGAEPMVRHTRLPRPLLTPQARPLAATSPLVHAPWFRRGSPFNDVMLAPQVHTHGPLGLADGPALGDETFDFPAPDGDVHVPVADIHPYMFGSSPLSPLLADAHVPSSLATTCNFTCDPNTASCGGFSEPLDSGACSGVTITQGPAPVDTVCVGSTCIQSQPGSIEVQYALAPPPPPTAPTRGAARPTPAHLVLAAHAMVFGFASATVKMLSGDGKGWQQDFQSDSTDAATTVTPVGGYVLRSAFSHTS